MSSATPILDHQRRASSQLSNISEVAGFRLSPPIMQIESKKSATQKQGTSALSMKQLSGQADSHLRKSSTGADQQQKPSLDASNYGNIIQTKAQQQAQHPDLAYVKRDSANDKIAKANAIKQRKHSRNTARQHGQTQPINNKSAALAPNQVNGPHAIPQQIIQQKKKVSQNNIDIAHMSESFANRENMNQNSQPSIKQDNKSGGIQQRASDSQKGASSQLSSGIHQNSHLPMKGQNQNNKVKLGATNKNAEMLIQTIITTKDGTVGKSQQQYARFRLQEHIKMLARPKNAAICAPRLRELSNVVFEQQVAHQFDLKRNKSAGNHQQKIAANAVNNNFKGPYHLAAQFRSHKVGESANVGGIDTELISPSSNHYSQPFYEASVTIPKTYRPQSHYGRATQEQMITSAIIQEETTMQNANSSNLLYRPQSLRERQFKQNTRNNNQCQTSTMPSSAMGLQTYPIKVQVNSRGRASLAIEQNAQSHNMQQFNTISQIGEQTRQKPIRNMSAHCNSKNYGRPAARAGRNFQTMTVSQRTTQPRIQGNELKIRQTKIHDASTTVTRQDRIEAFESFKLREKYYEEVKKNTATNTSINQYQYDVKQDISNHLSRHTASIQKSALQMNQSARASTRSPHIDRNTQELSQGGVIVNKNVTVFDKIGTQTMENTIDARQDNTKSNKKALNEIQATLNNEQQIIIDCSQEESMNYAASQESIQKITDQVLSSSNFILSENQQPTDLQKKESNALVEKFQNDKLQNFMTTLDNKNSGVNSSRVSPSPINQPPINGGKAEKPSNNSTMMQQYTNRQLLERQQHEEAYQVKNVTDLKSLSSNEDHRMAPIQQSNIKTSRASPQKQKQSSTISVERIAAVNSAASLLQNQHLDGSQIKEATKGPLMVSKSRLSRMRQQARRAKVSQLRHQSFLATTNMINSDSSRSLQPTPGAINHHREARSCEKCTHKELESTKKQIDLGHLNANKSKVYFKPSVVEIQDESLPWQTLNSTSHNKTSSSLRTKEGQSCEALPANKQQQNYLLGPHVSQDYENLGSIREESHYNGMRSSIDSNAMQALFAQGEAGCDTAEFEVNPETREFILYLQQVQPDLIIQTSANAGQSVAAELNEIFGAGQPATALLPRSGGSISPKSGAHALAASFGSIKALIPNNQQQIYAENQQLQKRETLNNVILEENSMDNANGPSRNSAQKSPSKNNQGSDHFDSERNQKMLHSLETLGQPNSGRDVQQPVTMTDLREQDDFDEDNLLQHQKQQQQQQDHQEVGQLDVLENQRNQALDGLKSNDQFITSSQTQSMNNFNVNSNNQEVEEYHPHQNEVNETPVDTYRANNEGNGAGSIGFDNDQPVNYTGQINMMQEIFKQIANQRANASRTTVRSQKVIYQSMRRQEFKPISEHTRRYPSGSTGTDGITHVKPRPSAKVTQQPGSSIYPWVERANNYHAARGAGMNRTARLQNEQCEEQLGGNRAFKLDRTQLGAQGQFADLLNRKRADKKVTWDVEPSVRHSNNHSFKQQTTQRSYHTSQNSYYQEDSNHQVPRNPMYTTNDQQAMVQYHQMSAIKEVPSISHLGGAKSSTNRSGASGNSSPSRISNKHSGQNNNKNDIAEDFRMQVIDQLQEKIQNHSSRRMSFSSQQQNTADAGVNKSKMGVNADQQEGAQDSKLQTQQVSQIAKSVKSTSRTTGRPKHREGRPIAGECQSESSDDEQKAQKKGSQSAKVGTEISASKVINTTKSKKLQEEENKNNLRKIGGDKIDSKNRISSQHAETVEWSHITGKPPQKKDEFGNALTHKGNIIRRGFNTGQQRKTRIMATNDKNLLKNENLKHLFNEDKHKITNYIANIGPPTKKTPELSKQQWRRIQKAQFNYENMDEKHHEKHRKHRSAADVGHKRRTKGDKNRSQADLGMDEESLANKAMNSGRDLSMTEDVSHMIEDKGNLFSFSNPDRYKTDQLKEQAMALLVPGYLQYIYDIN